MLCQSAISHVFDVRTLCVCVFFSGSGKDKRCLPSASFFIRLFATTLLPYRHAIACIRLPSLHGKILQLMLVQSRCCIAQSQLSPLSATTDHPITRGASRHATLARCHLTKTGSGSCSSLRLLYRRLDATQTWTPHHCPSHSFLLFWTMVSDLYGTSGTRPHSAPPGRPRGIFCHCNVVPELLEWLSENCSSQ